MSPGVRLAPRLGAWHLWPQRFKHRSQVARQSAGYNLVVLAVAVTVLNIVAAKALPMWSTMIQRAKEEELIFRGLQYAEAIRVYQMNNGGLPTKLEQLVEGDRRYIRQLWENPLAEDGSWILVPAAQGRQVQDQNRRGNRRGNPRGNPQGRDGRGGPGADRSLLWVPGKEQQASAPVPISGVKSSVGGTAIKVFAPLGSGGGEDYAQWQFTVDLLQGLGQRGVGAGDNAVQIATLNAGDIGRPWPPGISLPRFQGGSSGVPNRGNRNNRGNNNRGGGTTQQQGDGRNSR